MTVSPTIEAMIERQIHNIAEDRRKAKSWTWISMNYGLIDHAAQSTIEKHCKLIGMRHGYDMQSSKVAEYRAKIEDLTDDALVELWNSGGREAIIGEMVRRGCNRSNGDAQINRLARAGLIDHEPERKKNEWSTTTDTPGRIKAAIYTTPPSMSLPKEQRALLFRVWR